MQTEALPFICLDLDTVADFGHLELSLLTVVRADPLQALPRSFVTTFAGEPPSGLLQGQHAEAKQASEQDLKANGDLPLTRLSAGDIGGDAVIDPV